LGVLSNQFKLPSEFAGNQGLLPSTINSDCMKESLMYRKKAFTLIELLVVIAIIAVLMAILMPALQKVKEQARNQLCVSHLKNIGLGIIMYLQDNDYKMPNLHNDDYPHCNGHLWYDAGGNLLTANDDNSYWGVIYKDYVKEDKLFGCPTFKNFSQMVAQDMLYGTGDVDNAAYCINGWLSKENSNAIPRNSEVIVSHDHMEPKIENGNDMLCPDSSGVNLSQYRQGGNRANWYRGIFRHSIRIYGNDFETGGTLNCLWLDGHVTTIKETTGEDILKRYYDPLGKH
jgi:prepilin-type N-terminal cleavage/methylation domain-containing protein/prepilin-type processing-associated H-X9-DG protein